jgi:hypothetical protein
MDSAKLVLEKDGVVRKESDLAIKREQIIARLKQDSNHSLKGKLDLLNKIRKQKESNATRESQFNNNPQAAAAEESVENVILKQQNLLQKLNSEHVHLIEENDKLRKFLSNKSTAQESKKEFLERERSLREQLHLSQKYSVHFLNKYVSVLKE